jgi:hypothetical protein
VTKYNDEKNPYPRCDSCDFLYGDSCAIPAHPCPHDVYEDAYEQALKDVKEKLCSDCNAEFDRDHEDGGCITCGETYV